jgi:hypothetical protein
MNNLIEGLIGNTEETAQAVNVAAKPLTFREEFHALIGEYQGEEEGTFIIPSEDGVILRLFDEARWRNPKVPEGFVRLCTSYVVTAGDFNDRSVFKRNSMNFRGEIRTLKAIMKRWKRAGEIQAIVFHLEYTESQIKADADLTRHFNAGRLSMKMLPASEDREATPLLYGGENAYMYQNFVEMPFSVKNAKHLTIRLENDDESEARSADAKKVYEAARAARLEISSENKAAKLISDTAKNKAAQKRADALVAEMAADEAAKAESEGKPF